MKIGLIGVGSIGSVYAEILRGMELTVSTCDPLAGRAQFQKLEELLQEGLDGVIVCTPPGHHLETVLTCLNSGLPVLCEKPLGMTPEQIERVLEAARSNEQVVMPASKFLFLEEVTQARRLVLEGVIGAPLFFRNRFLSQIDMAKSWHSDPRVSGGGVLADNGTHSADLARYFFGPVQTVACAFPKSVQNLEVEDSAHVLLDCSGVIGTVELSWSVDSPTETYFEVTGSEGTLKLGWRGSAYRRKDSELLNFAGPYCKVRGIRNQVEHFLACLRGECEPLVGVTEALASARVLQAAYRAQRAGGLVVV